MSALKAKIGNLFFSLEITYFLGEGPNVISIHLSKERRGYYNKGYILIVRRWVNQGEGNILVITPKIILQLVRNGRFSSASDELVGTIVEERYEYNERFKSFGFDTVTNRIKIMIKNTGRIMSANLYDIHNTDVMDNLSRDEVKSIYRKAYNSGQQMDTQYDITSYPARQWILYSIFCLIITVCYIFSNISVVKPVFFSGLEVLVTSGVFVYPLTFLIVDLLNEFYGFTLARRAIYMCVCSNALLLLLLSLSLYLPVLPEWVFNSSYKILITQIQSAFIASTLAFFFSELANSYILIKIKKLTKSKYLYIRLISSTFIASILDSIIFCFIAFYGIMEQRQIIQIIYVQIAVKFIYSLINVFPAYGARYIFNRYLAE